MKYLKKFEYFEPSTLNEALNILKKHSGEAKILAGGTDLLVKMKGGLIAPKYVVNIKSISDIDLRGIAVNAHGGIKLGALTTLQTIQDSPLVKERASILAETAKKMASHQVRNIATIGGNLCNAAPSADMAPPLIVLDAEAKILGSKGERTIKLENFFLGPSQTSLDDDEILLEIYVPEIDSSVRTIYEKFTLRDAMDIATVGVAVSLKQKDGLCEAVKISLGAVGPTPIRARQSEEVLLGEKIGETVIKKASKTASEEAKPIDDIRGSAQYRRQLIESLVRRSIQAIAQY
jgi:carbon-monoxide dehydrogenase medium subunit